MTTSSQYLNGVLTIATSPNVTLSIDWQVPLNNGTFDQCTSMVLRQIAAMAAHQNRDLRDLLAQAVVESFMIYASSPDDEADVGNDVAHSLLTSYLKLLADHLGSPNLTFFVSDDRIVKIDVEPQATPDVESRLMIHTALLLEEITAGSRSSDAPSL